MDHIYHQKIMERLNNIEIKFDNKHKRYTDAYIIVDRDFGLACIYTLTLLLFIKYIFY